MGYFLKKLKKNLQKKDGFSQKIVKITRQEIFMMRLSFIYVLIRIIMNYLDGGGFVSASSRCH